jgi:hypothetical protein
VCMTRAVTVSAIPAISAVSTIQWSHAISTYSRINDSGFYTRCFTGLRTKAA